MNDVPKRKLRFIFSINKMRNRSESIGRATLKYVTSLPQGSNGGPDEFCLKQFGDANEVKTAKVMTTETDK